MHDSGKGDYNNIKSQILKGISNVCFSNNWVLECKCQTWWWLHPYLQWCVLQRWVHQTLCWAFVRTIFYCTFIKWVFWVKYKCHEERKCFILCWKKQRKAWVRWNTKFEKIKKDLYVPKCVDIMLKNFL